MSGRFSYWALVVLFGTVGALAVFSVVADIVAVDLSVLSIVLVATWVAIVVAFVLLLREEYGIARRTVDNRLKAGWRALGRSLAGFFLGR